MSHCGLFFLFYLLIVGKSSSRNVNEVTTLFLRKTLDMKELRYLYFCRDVFEGFIWPSYILITFPWVLRDAFVLKIPDIRI